MIEGDVRAKLATVPGIGDVRVRFVYDPPWSVDRISEAGRTALREHGVTVPDVGGRLDVPAHAGTVQLRTSAVRCPFCGSDSTYLDSPFGPTRCRMIYYCNACRNSFEHMRQV
jgi:ring-1,2-phenylacetyl-CoA epoxidase subunit PaaD